MRKVSKDGLMCHRILIPSQRSLSNFFSVWYEFFFDIKKVPGENAVATQCQRSSHLHWRNWICRSGG